MMKKSVCLLLVPMLCFSLISCGNTEHIDVPDTLKGSSIRSFVSRADAVEDFREHSSNIPLSEKPIDSSNQTEAGTLSDHSESQIAETQQSAAAPPEDSIFAVHFIDVGQADAALVLCDGEAMLIDGGNAGDSDLIYTYLKNMSIDHLEYIVCTHAHEDHVGGLAGALR